MRPRLKDAAAAPGEAALSWTQDVRLPVASPPCQMPKLVSAGIALSPYQRDAPASNALLGRKFAGPRFDRLQIEDRPRASTRDMIGRADFDQKTVEAVLASLALPADSPLSVLAVELLPSGGLNQDLPRLMLPLVDVDLAFAVTSDAAAPAPADPFPAESAPFAGITPAAAVTDPLGTDLGTIRSHRILRASPPTPVPPDC